MEIPVLSLRCRLLAFSLLLSAPAVFAGQDCSRLPISGQQPQWVSSAAYLAPMDKLAIVDPLRNKLVLLDLQGAARDYDSARLGVTEEAMTPAIVSSTPQGLALMMVDQQVYWYGPDFKKLKVSDLAKASVGSQGKVLGTYDSVYNGNYFFSVGAVKPADGKLRVGFFRMPAADPTRFKFLTDIPAPDYYVLGHQYITTLHGNDYAILMSEHPTILEFSRNGEHRVLDVIPKRFKVSPLKTPATGPSSDEPMYREIEGLSIPVGLYHQGDYLYLLTREPGATGSTIWRLYRIDPKQGRLVGQESVLPTSANHLTAVAGTNSWYFIEKGPVLPRGNQEVKTILTISKAAVLKHTIPSQCPSQ